MKKMLIATDVFNKENKIEDAAVLAVYWHHEDEPRYYAVPAKDADTIARNWLDSRVADRVERVPESELADKWISIVECSIPGALSTWGKAEITVIEYS
jgi:hypothetical protein